MTTDHDFDGLYDLRDLQDSDAWFTDAAARSLGTSDPLSPSVVAMLERLDRELASLAPLDRGTVTALITGLNEPPVEARTTRRSARVARHARRNLVVVGVTGALLVAAGGVAAASPGSFFYPVREAAFGSADEQSAPEDLSDVESELNRIEVRIAEAQQAGGISESSRTALARRMGAIHPVVERASGDRADALRERWTRDDLVLIALPHLDVAAPPATTAPAPTPDGSTAPAPAPAPSTTPSASHDGGSGQSSPRTHPSAPADPQSSHSTEPKGDGHESKAPTPKPSASHHEGDHHPTSTPTPEHTRTPKPTPTSTGGAGTGTGTGTGQGKDD
jgi:hypothetical protein